MEKPEIPHIVEDYYIGHTHILIADNYCVKTKEEIDRILRNVERIAINCYRDYGMFVVEKKERIDDDDGVQQLDA